MAESKYFSQDNFVCHGDSEDNISEFGSGCGCNFSLPEDGMSQDLMDLLDAVQDKCIELYGENATLSFSCGFRCQTHNDRLPGSVPNSEHVQGYAADTIVPDCMTLDQLADVAIECGAGGVGKYNAFGMVHIDAGERRDWVGN